MAKYVIVTRGLDNPRERFCAAACLGLGIVYAVTFAGLLLASTRIDDKFFASREAVLLRRLLNFRLPPNSPVPLVEGGHISQSFKLESGWSVVEPWGVWTDGPHAALSFAMPLDGRSGVLQIWASVMLPSNGLQTIRLQAGSRLMGTWRLSHGQEVICAPLPSAFSLPPGVVRLDINVGSPTTPAGGLDARKLGLGLERLELLRDPGRCEHLAEYPSK
jgi:hypothetical protein